MITYPPDIQARRDFQDVCEFYENAPSRITEAVEQKLAYDKKYSQTLRQLLHLFLQSGGIS